MFYGEIENVGTQKAKLNFNYNLTQQKNSISIKAGGLDEDAEHLPEEIKLIEVLGSVTLHKYATVLIFLELNRMRQKHE